MTALPPFAAQAPEAYRARIESGVAVLPWCGRCARWFYYPRSRCPACGRADLVEFIEPTEHAVVRSLTLVRRAHSPAFAGASPSLMLACTFGGDANVIAEGWGWNASELPGVGDSVGYVVRRTADRGMLPMFVPLATG